MLQNYEEIQFANQVKIIFNGYGVTPLEILFYVLHPELLYQAKRNFDDANNFVNYWWCTNADNIDGNASKHAFWAGLNYLAWGHDLALEAVAAHESLALPINTSNIPKTNTKMDMFNNLLGLELAQEYVQEKGGPNIDLFKNMHLESNRNIIRQEFGTKVLKKISEGGDVRTDDNQLVPTSGSAMCKPKPW